MREILFRGKRTDNGEWVQGYFVAVNSKCYRGQQLTENTKSISCLNGTRYGFYNFYEIDPETVGQYTGMNDINGNKIFEGDIVHCKARIDRANMFVTFEDGKFVMVLCEEFTTHKRGLGHYEIECFDKEVIGNIYDNPELLTNENNDRSKNDIF